MSGVVTINGTDIRATYRAVLTSGSLAALMEFPQLRGIRSNDWFESDGLEVDMTDARWDKRYVRIHYAVSGGSWQAFTDFLTADPNQHLTVADIGYDADLHLVSIDNYAGASTDMALVTFDAYYLDADLSYFREGSLWRSYTLKDADDAHGIDGFNLGVFGLRSLRGRDSFHCPAALKEPLLVEKNEGDGSLAYYRAGASRSAKEIGINVLLRQSSGNDVGAVLGALGELFVLGDDGAANTLVSSWTGKSHSVVFKSLSFSDVTVSEAGFFALGKLALIQIDGD